MKNIILKEDRQTRGKENDTSHKLECLKPFTNFMFIYNWNLDFKALQRKKIDRDILVCAIIESFKPDICSKNKNNR